MLACAASGFEKAPRCIASKFLSCVWFAFVTITLVTYTAGIVNNLYWASMTHRSSPTRPRYLDLAHVVNSKDIKYGTVLSSQTYWCVIAIAIYQNKKLSYRRETARQLHTTTWAGQLTF